MRAQLVVASGLVAILATGATALAAPPWSEPQSVGAAAPLVSRATLAFAPNGTALLSRRISSGGQDRDSLATLAPDGRLVDHAPLPDVLAADPAVLHRGRVALARVRVASGPNARVGRVRLSLSVGTTARPAGRRRLHRLATYAPVPSDDTQGPALAVAPGGDLAIAWMEYRGDEFALGTFRVRLALRRADGRFERTRTVAAGDVDGNRESHSVAVAFGARRDVVVAYAIDDPGGGRFIAARTLRRGKRLGRQQILGPQAGLNRIELQATHRGRTIVAWSTQDGGEEANSPAVVRAAIRAPGAARFVPTRVMDPGEANERAPGRLALAMAPDGSAVLAWSNARGQYPGLSFPARASIAEPGAGFGPVFELAANGAVTDAAARSDGALLVTWADVHDFTLAGPRESRAALRPGPGQPFGAPELIATSSPGLAGGGRALVAAFDPRTGRPAAAWTATNDGSDVLQLATRSG